MKVTLTYGKADAFSFANGHDDRHGGVCISTAGEEQPFLKRVPEPVVL